MNRLYQIENAENIINWSNQLSTSLNFNRILNRDIYIFGIKTLKGNRRIENVFLNVLLYINIFTNDHVYIIVF